VHDGIYLAAIILALRKVVATAAVVVVVVVVLCFAPEETNLLPGSYTRSLPSST
jgi:hypothetical protein